MAKLIRKTTEELYHTSFTFNEIAWVIFQIMRRQNPDCSAQDILLYITQCVDDNNINLRDYYTTYREYKKNKTAK